MHVLNIVDVDAIRRRKFTAVLDRPPWGRGRLGGRFSSVPWAASRSSSAALPRRSLRSPSRNRLEANLQAFSAIVPPREPSSAFAQDPDADRLALVDETGRCIGEELTPSAGGSRGDWPRSAVPLVLNLSTSRVSEDLARATAARSTAPRSARSMSSIGCERKGRCSAGKATVG